MKKISDLSPAQRQALLQFNFTGGPLDDIEGVEKPLLAFGLVAMAWARLETHLDALLIHLNKRRFSREIFNPNHPVSFSNKLKLLKQWFVKHKALSPHKHAVDKLVTRLKTLSAARNEALHAIFSAYDPKKDEITLRSLRYMGNDEFHIARREFSTTKLVSLAAAATNANRSLAAITSKLFTVSAVEQLQKP
jgi:hypothetical protein